MTIVIGSKHGYVELREGCEELKIYSNIILYGDRLVKLGGNDNSERSNKVLVILTDGPFEVFLKDRKNE